MHGAALGCHKCSRVLRACCRWRRSHAGACSTTRRYAAPEQLSSRSHRRYGPEVDLFPAGLILLELVCPFSTGAPRTMAVGAGCCEPRAPPHSCAPPPARPLASAAPVQTWSACRPCRRRGAPSPRQAPPCRRPAVRGPSCRLLWRTRGSQSWPPRSCRTRRATAPLQPRHWRRWAWECPQAPCTHLLARAPRQLGAHCRAHRAASASRLRARCACRACQARALSEQRKVARQSAPLWVVPLAGQQAGQQAAARPLLDRPWPGPAAT